MKRCQRCSEAIGRKQRCYCRSCARAVNRERVRERVRARLVANVGVRLRSKVRRGLYWNIEEDGVLIALYGLGVNSPRIAQFLDRSVCGVQHRAQYIGLTFPAAKPRQQRERVINTERQEKNTQVASLRACGLSYSQIAEQEGLTRSAVAGRLWRVRKAAEQGASA